MPAPKGNRNAYEGRKVREAMDRALKMYESDEVAKGTALLKICEVQVRKALDGDRDAAGIVFDRTEGKAVATNVLETGGNGFTINIVK